MTQTSMSMDNVVDDLCCWPTLELHLTTSELWFGQEQEGIFPELLSSSGIV